VPEEENVRLSYCIWGGQAAKIHRMYTRHQKPNRLRNFSFLVTSALALTTASTASGFNLMESLGLKKIDPSELIEIKVEYAPDRCSEEYPMLVAINNGSDETIQFLQFDIWGKREKYSTLLYSAHRLKSDRIISPSKSHSACWKAPRPNLQGTQHPIETIIWLPEITRIEFEER
jgi:hypothetical protein